MGKYLWKIRVNLVYLNLAQTRSNISWHYFFSTEHTSDSMNASLFWVKSNDFFFLLFFLKKDMIPLFYLPKSHATIKSLSILQMRILRPLNFGQRSSDFAISLYKDYWSVKTTTFGVFVNPVEWVKIVETGKQKIPYHFNSTVALLCQI